MTPDPGRFAHIFFQIFKEDTISILTNPFRKENKRENFSSCFMDLE